MKIAVLSGKGGTGKTTVSTNLAVLLDADYIDCDVEEPNGFLFLNPAITKSKTVMQNYPSIITGKCTLCKECVKACQFNALAKAGDEIVVFEKLCHDCGVCKMVCENEAIKMCMRPVGIIENGISGGIECRRGILNIGEPMAVPVIRELIEELSVNDSILDCPPGTSCSVVAAIKNADAAILVTEPTKFGLHDLQMAEKLVDMYRLPYGIILNKDDEKENVIKKYCKESGARLLGSIPFEREAAKAYSNGEMLINREKYRKIFFETSRNIKEVFV